MHTEQALLVYLGIYTYIQMCMEQQLMKSGHKFERARRSLWEGSEAGKGKGEIMQLQLQKVKNPFLFLKKKIPEKVQLEVC